MSEASSVYSSDFDDDDEKGLIKQQQQQQQQPSPATLAREAPDLRRLVLERSNTAISRKSVGGQQLPQLQQQQQQQQQQKVGFAMSYYGGPSIPPPPPKAVGTGAIKGINNNNDNINEQLTNNMTAVMTPTATTIVKTGGSKYKTTKQLMKGFQLGQPPPGKLSLFPKSSSSSSSSSDGTSSGGNSPVDNESDDGNEKGTPRRLESWLRRERGVVSPFAAAAPGGKK
ncbi:hypothetical protein B0T21DRAFT_354803 [Apiosordaria backusii]|uniref:Uncharacterized protein n=1 Tax=Apiosordaria backusii TaxID=314023 RepID=A0AA40EY30_9PEZI|nr:hypothetical protein B0T21DRAFT_354803 [Apiosordaria backusii]